MINRFYKPVFYLAILLILQLTLVELISYKNFRPDLLLIGLIYFTLMYGQIPGIVVAFFFGLLLDIFGGGVIGANSLSKVSACFVAGYFSSENENDFEISVNFFVIIFLITLLEKIIYIFVAVNLDFKVLIIVLIQHGLIPSVVTLVFSLFVLFIPRRNVVR